MKKFNFNLLSFNQAPLSLTEAINDEDVLDYIEALTDAELQAAAAPVTIILNDDYIDDDEDLEYADGVRSVA